MPTSRLDSYSLQLFCYWRQLTAGINEIGRFDPREEGDATKLTKPNLKTLDVDLTAVMYTTRIALWYFINDKRKEPGLRAVAFTGSMSTFYGSEGVMYGAAKA